MKTALSDISRVHALLRKTQIETAICLPKKFAALHGRRERKVYYCISRPSRPIKYLDTLSACCTRNRFEVYRVASNKAKGVNKNI